MTSVLLRTRIIATHHIELCLAKAQYFIRLDRGSVVDQKYIVRNNQEEHDRDLAETGRDLFKVFQSTSKSADYPGEPSNGLESCEGESLPNRALDARKPTIVPKKFIEEEKRQIGAVKLQTYKLYLSATGGTIIFLIIIWVHSIYTISIMGTVSSMFFAIDHSLKTSFVVMVA